MAARSTEAIPATRISVVVPVLDEAGGIGAALTRLAPLRAAAHEVIVVDGGSGDGTAELARAGADRVIVAERGRARQMNAGAQVASGDVLLFLHADTTLPDGAANAITGALEAGAWRWGRFDVRLSGSAPGLRVIETAMNLRSRVTGIATGDQALFVERRLFEEVGGFPDIDLMEDVALCARLKRRAGRPSCLRERVVTSSRRWERDGIVRTVMLMWRLRVMYRLGADPAALHRRYYPS